MNRLTINLLGPPEVSYQDKILKFRSRKVLALLVYLVVEGELQSRDHLIALFWPDSSHEPGMASLRNTLARLRKSLAAAGQFLVTQQGLVGFDFSQDFDLDLQVLETAVQPDSSEEMLRAALALQRGPFLAGFDLPDAPDFEAWVTFQRSFWEQRLETLFDQLSQQQLSAGKNHAAIETLSQWLAETPYHETAYQRLMKAYTFAGDRASALRVYEQCRQLLETDLGLAPAPETTALARRIAEDPQLSSEQRSLPAQEVTSSPSARLIIPFVGRVAEQAQLRAVYQALPSGAQIVIVRGDAGLGKTQLVENFLAWAGLEMPQADILRGRAFEMGGHLPYQPLIDALRMRIDQENAPEDLLDDIWLSELSQLLPELRGRYPDLAPPMAGSADFVRGRLFEAVAILGQALAEKRPLILFIDDMQWTDAGTRDMLHYLAQRWTATNLPILLLITVRQEGLLTQPALQDWLTSLGRGTTLSQIKLQPLATADLQELAWQWSGNDVEQREAAHQFGAWLKAETDGSPFFVTELLQMLVEQEVLSGEVGADGRMIPALQPALRQIQAIDRVPLPPNVRDVILARFNRLAEKAQTMLLVGAVIGRECSFERLCQVAGLDELEGLPALEELLAARLMLETASQDRPFTFAHDNIRDVVYTEAGATRRRLFHRRLFTLLQAGEESAAELAFQAIAARLPQEAFHYSLAAGDKAQKLNAFVEAVGHYNHALEYVEQVDPPSQELRALYSQRGRALELCGHYAVALENYQTMIAVARRMNDPALELAALVAEGTIRATANEYSDFDLGEQLGERALKLAHELDDKTAEARIQWNMLNVYRMTGRNEEALAAGSSALALAEELGLREEMAYAANDLVYIYMAQGEVAPVLALGERAIALWRELGNQPMLTDSLINYANTQAMIGAYDQALAIAAEALQISRSLDNQWAQSFSLYTYSMVYKQMMVVDQALEAMGASIRLGHVAGFTGAQVLIRDFQAELRLSLGDLAGARELAEAAVDIARKNIPLFLPASQGVLAQAAVVEGNLKEAGEILAGVEVERYQPNLMGFLTTETAVCAHALAGGNDELAYNYSTQVLAYLTQQNLRMHIPDFLYFQGRALLGLRRPDEALQALDRALEILRQTGGRRNFVEIATLLAGLVEQAGRQDTAAALTQEAQTVYHFIREHIPDSDLRAAYMASSAI